MRYYPYTRKKKYFTFLLSFSVGIIVICIKYNNGSSQTFPNTYVFEKQTIRDTLPMLMYHYDSIADIRAWHIFKEKYTIAQLKIIAAINRMDYSRIRIGSHLVVPDTIFTNFIRYSPFPQELSFPDSIPKFILVNQRIQLFAAYENGKLIRSGPVSSGRASKQTPNKLYYTNYKAKRKVSTVDGSWIMPWYFNISNRAGIGMHQYTLPGYPASHSCVRMHEEDAYWLFNWAQQWTLTTDQTTVLTNGTPVLIFGKYDFSQKGPWKSLPNDPHALDLTPEEYEVVIKAITMVRIHP